MQPVWTADWVWSLVLTALTTAIHVAALLAIAAVLVRITPAVERPGRSMTSKLAMAIVGMASIGWILAALHGLAAAIWAVAYLRLGALQSPADAILYSVDSMTARGASGVHVERPWQLMGALEAANGLLLFGISTAFLAGLINEIRFALGVPRGRVR